MSVFGLKVNIDEGGGSGLEEGFIEVHIFFVPRLNIFKLFDRAWALKYFLSVCYHLLS